MPECLACGDEIITTDLDGAWERGLIRTRLGICRSCADLRVEWQRQWLPIREAQHPPLFPGS